jgi:hypothetical protein
MEQFPKWRGAHDSGEGKEDNLAAAAAEAERKCIQRVLAKTGGS